MHGGNSGRLLRLGWGCLGGNQIATGVIVVVVMVSYVVVCNGAVGVITVVTRA